MARHMDVATRSRALSDWPFVRTATEYEAAISKSNAAEADAESTTSGPTHARREAPRDIAPRAANAHTVGRADAKQMTRKIPRERRMCACAQSLTR